MTSHTGSNYGTIQFSGGSYTATFTAPSTGPTAGIAIWVDKNAGVSNQSQFAGGSTITINGALYAPGSTVAYSGGSSNASSCMELIADMIHFSGGASFTQNCGGYGMLNAGGGTGGGQTAVVE